ncbi:transketolase [Devosia sp.]|uniref:transketolase n=1 Tax=Devosia sp. TaxID=1871048 RepID=UPI002AFF6897|nr:transketolase [Devosia sp.]
MNAAHLKTIEQRLLWLSHWMIHNANHLREKVDGIKIGGHQASSASMVSIMTALYFSALRPEDRVAVKPHAGPVFHAMHYLMGNLDLERMKNFRGFGGVQSYPSRTKDADDVDFSTGSVGLGVAITSFASLVQDYIAGKPWGADAPRGRMVALMGDAEVDEGNVHECLQEGWKHDLRNVWWVIDYNRQSLDGVVREGLWSRIERLFDAFGWDVVKIKYGILQRAAFAEPGGERLRQWIDDCPNQLYAALTFSGGAVWRQRLLDDLGDQSAVSALIGRRDDRQLAALMENLGGNCVQSMAEAFAAVDHDRPVCFLAYTVKGWGTPIAGHKDNHGGLMTKAQMAAWQQHMQVPEGREWEPMAAVPDPDALRAFLARVPFFAAGPRRLDDKRIAVPPLPAPKADRETSTQAAFGRILDDLARGDSPLAERIVTMSPDVTGTTGLGAWVNRRKLWAREARADLFRAQNIPSTAKWDFAPEGQHIELGIAEMNLFLQLGAAGLSHRLFGKRLLPIGTVYDPFVCRGLDALNYACYQDSRFLIAGTPSGVTLAPEGGAHQSISTPLIGLAQDGLAAFEPAFAEELAIIMHWAFDYMQRDGDARVDPRTWLRDASGGAVYLRLTTRPVEQASLPQERLTQGVIDGGYWLRPPGPNCDVVIAYQGAVAPEAIAAAGLIGQGRRDVGVLAVTSADRLNAGWTAAQRARWHGEAAARSQVECLLAPLPRHCRIVTVIDGHPATLSWLGSVAGHCCIPLGVEHFGQTGTIGDLYAHFGIDTASIVRAVSGLTAGRGLIAE